MAILWDYVHTLTFIIAAIAGGLYLSTLTREDVESAGRYLFAFVLGIPILVFTSLNAVNMMQYMTPEAIQSGSFEFSIVGWGWLAAGIFNTIIVFAVQWARKPATEVTP